MARKLNPIENRSHPLNYPFNFNCPKISNIVRALYKEKSHILKLRTIFEIFKFISPIDFRLKADSS